MEIFQIGNPQFWFYNNLYFLNFNTSSERSHWALPGNEIKSKIECMELNQKFTFPPKRSQNVASPLRDDLPWHRITLRAEDEPSCSTSHLNYFFLDLIDFWSDLLLKLRKKSKNSKFSKFSNFDHFFRKILRSVFRIFNPWIIFRS